jgi:hypothetical protein
MFDYQAIGKFTGTPDIWLVGGLAHFYFSHHIGNNN